MATCLLARWLQTKNFLLIELERLNHKTYYKFNIIYVYFGDGGGGGGGWVGGGGGGAGTRPICAYG